MGLNDELEIVQKRAARFVTRNWDTIFKGLVTTVQVRY